VNRFQAAIIIYGLIMLGMAVQAYLVKASVMSLVAGGGVGVIEIGLAALSKTHPRVGYIGAAVVALIPLGRFIPTLVKDGQLVIYPALIGTVLSVGLALFLVGGHFMSKRKPAQPATAPESPADPPTSSSQ